VTASDFTNADHVVIQCPACGARESAEPQVLADAPTIVCRECGETWPAAPPRRRRRQFQGIDLVGETKAHLESNVIDARRRPLATYSDGAESAWAAKVSGDYWPEPPRQRRFPMIAGAIAALVFLGAFFGGREAAVTALPDLASLYAAIGLPVHLDGIAIEDVAAERSSTSTGDRIVVRGMIRNVSRDEMAVPQLAAILYDSAKVPALGESFDPPAETIARGEAAPFLLTLDGVPPQATEVAVRFRRPGERLPQGAVAVQSTTQ
jgi:hypothetical protein